MVSLPRHPSLLSRRGWLPVEPCLSTCGLFSSATHLIHPSFIHGSLTQFVFSAANLPADCINLGQGYMNFPPPQWVKDAADVALNTVAGNHYSHPKGRIRLREALRDFYSKHFNRTLDVENEILISSGANEGILVYSCSINTADLLNRAICCVGSMAGTW
jgi:DNA-binding transcriptional MocR family regulator